MFSFEWNLGGLHDDVSARHSQYIEKGW